MKEGWTYKKIGEVASFINGDRGKNYPSQKDFVESGIPFINAGHLNDGNIDFDSMNYINDEKYDSLNSGKVKEGDILFCLRGSLGKKAIVKNVERGAIASSLVIIRSTSIFNQYLNYYLGSPTITRYIKRNNNGSSQPNLSAKSVSSFILPIPPLAEQERIVAELDLLTSIIDKKKAQLKELDQLAQSIFYTMFGDPITNEKGWEVKKMGEIADITDYVANGSFATLRENVHYLDKAGYAILVRLADFTNNFDSSRFVYIDEHAYNFLSKSKLYGGEIIMSNVGSIGKSFICPKLSMPMSLAPNSIVIKTPNNVFYYHFLMSPYFQDILKTISSKTALPKFNKTQFKGLTAPIPPLPLQQEFASKVEAIERQKTLIQQSIDEVQTMFDGRMDYWFG